MSRFYLCSRIKDVKKAAEEISGVGGFVFFRDIEDFRIKSFLLSLNRFHYFNKFELVKNKDDLVNKVKKFLALLNREHKSRTWWALTFTAKNPITTYSKLPSNMLNYLSLVRSVSSGLLDKFENIILIVDEDMLIQASAWCNLKNIYYKKYRHFGLFLSSFIKIFPLAIIAIFLKTIFLKLYSRFFLACQFYRKKEYVVIQSLISEHSFVDGKYKDLYFGDLYYFFKQRDIPVLVFGALFSPLLKILREIKKNRNEACIIPMVYFCSFYNLLCCFGEAVKKHYFPFSLGSDHFIDDIPVNILVEVAKREECQTRRFFSNVLPYYCSISLNRYIRIKKIFYPCENQPWEKSLLFGFRKKNPNIKIMGYQHSSISSRHWNYTLEKEEVLDYPLPDIILTNGEMTYRKLIKNLGIENRKIKIACALRYDETNTLPFLRRKPKRILNLLFALASSYEEYINTVLFLNTIPNFFDTHIILRPHPLLDLHHVLKGVTPIFKYTIDTSESFGRSLERADVLLYASSTASLEALSFGIPIIYLHLPDFCDTDPLLDFNDFKWNVRSGKDLMSSLQEIDSMSKEEYAEKQKRGKEYVGRYFYAVNKNNVEVFFE